MAAISIKKFEQFLEQLEEYPNVTEACKIIGISRKSAYNRRDADEAFAKRWDKAKEKGIDALEDYAFRRAMSGESDTMTIFMLKGNRPQKYADRQNLNLTGDVTVSLNMVVNGEKD